MKKIIALSTLNQLGIIIISLRLGLKILGLYHLLTHAIFKSLLFMCAGIIIHLTNGNQDIRFYGQLKERLPFISLRLHVSILSLMGIPFISGFYSKDLLIKMISWNTVLLNSLLEALPDEQFGKRGSHHDAANHRAPLIGGAANDRVDPPCHLRHLAFA